MKNESENGDTGTGASVCCAPILDVCCGSRMFWFDKNDNRATFIDKRCETVRTDSRQGRREIVVNPDIIGDFTDLPFADESRALVVFDPPHLTRNGKNSWMAKKYGRLEGNWKEEIRKGFAECFRVLKNEGVLVFKWNELDVPVSQILELAAPEKPLFGNRSGKASRGHWIVFMKTHNNHYTNGRNQQKEGYNYGRN